MFYPQNAGRTVFKSPTNRQLRIDGCVTRELLAVPGCFDSNGEPCLIVMKVGNTTDLTVGRYAGLEAYLCDDLGVESVELAIYNYDKQSGPSSAKGDSGSLIFDGEGHMVGILHSGMPKGGSVVGHRATQTQVSARRLQPNRLLNANTIVGHLLSHLPPPSPSTTRLLPRRSVIYWLVFGANRCFDRWAAVKVRHFLLPHPFVHIARRRR
jgi:hypothetical protein